MARAMAFAAHSWAGGGIHFIDAPPLSYTPLWLVLLSLVVFDSVEASAELTPVRARFGY